MNRFVNVAESYPLLEEELQQVRSTPLNVIKGRQLVDQTPRVLLSGYSHRGDHEVSLGTDGVIRMFSGGFEVDESEIGSNDQYINVKRLNPELCDTQFVAMLVAAGEYPPFTNFPAPVPTASPTEDFV